MDSLETLKSIVAEIETARASAKSRTAYDKGLIIRLALYQLDHGPMRYGNNDPRWNSLLKLAEAGELGFSFGGGTVEIVRGTHMLTAEDLANNPNHQRAENGEIKS